MLFSLALFQHKLHTISRSRKTSLGSKSTLKPCDLPAESGMPVLRTTTLVRICTQTRPYIPNGNIATFSFAVEGFGRNSRKRERCQESLVFVVAHHNPTFLNSDILAFAGAIQNLKNVRMLFVFRTTGDGLKPLNLPPHEQYEISKKCITYS